MAGLSGSCGAWAKCSDHQLSGNGPFLAAASGQEARLSCVYYYSWPSIVVQGAICFDDLVWQTERLDEMWFCCNGLALSDVQWGGSTDLSL